MAKEEAVTEHTVRATITLVIPELPEDETILLCRAIRALVEGYPGADVSLRTGGPLPRLPIG